VHMTGKELCSTHRNGKVFVVVIDCSFVFTELTVGIPYIAMRPSFGGSVAAPPRCCEPALVKAYRKLRISCLLK